ncbi:MAG TPA: GntR family transcriptional regulator [Beijerinckiaceae bacterium]|nr:GntR family transcriptional regulator [Beijerinckiaceae bacterium]
MNYETRIKQAFDLTDTGGLESGTLSHRVYAHLSQLLVSGKLAPNDKLSFRAVAESLGTSMMPVREAISRLVAEKALVVEPKKAAFVPVMSATGFRDITRVRIIIEGAASAMAASSATQSDLQDIARCEIAFRNLEGDPRAVRQAAVAANQAFHFAVYRAAHSGELLAIIERLWLRVGPVINLDLRENPERMKFGGAIRYHAALLDGIRQRDPQAARAALAADIQGAADFILSQGKLPE